MHHVLWTAEINPADSPACHLLPHAISLDNNLKWGFFNFFFPMVLSVLRLCTSSTCKQALFAKEPLFPGSFCWLYSPSSYCYFAFLFYSLFVKLIIWFYYTYQLPENIMFQKRSEKAGFRNTSANSKTSLSCVSLGAHRPLWGSPNSCSL